MQRKRERGREGERKGGRDIARAQQPAETDREREETSAAAVSCYQGLGGDAAVVRTNSGSGSNCLHVGREPVLTAKNPDIKSMRYFHAGENE